MEYIIGLSRAVEAVEREGMERTLIILKPDAIECRKVGAVLGRFEEAGFQIAACRMVQLDETILVDHYAHLALLPFFPRILKFMSSRPVLICILEGPGVISRVRNLLGPTDSTTAPAGTIRGDWGTDKMRNLAHASDSLESAAAEIRRFFPELE